MIMAYVVFFCLFFLEMKYLGIGIWIWIWNGMNIC